MSDTLMISVSGMRGLVGTDLTPELVARHAAALGAWVRSRGNHRVVLGRDARTSGAMFTHAAIAGFQSVGVDVVDVGVAPTPTVQMAVEYHHAGAGLIITASHNPIEWNALKFVGPDGIFLDAESGSAVRALAEAGPPRAGWDAIGTLSHDGDAIARHLDAVLALPEIDVAAIRARRFVVALDCVRGAGAPAMLPLFERLGVTVHGINLEADGRFPRAPEPIPENLGELGALVRQSGASVGMAVDPDVDRLALVDETGVPIGEDYTLALAIRAVLGAGKPSGNAPTVVVNLSTSLVVEDAARDGRARFLRAPVGEANVARMIVDERAVIGGEGNGGVMFPALHTGRDAPLAAALILQYLADNAEPLSRLVAAAPRYVIVKAKGKRGNDLEAQYRGLRAAFPDAVADDRDGLRLAWEDRWVHVRPSGTEPVVRFIAEARTAAEAEALVARARASGS
ncbi:MAG TPA: phosphoglucosamine mutase [Gemmatimonadales bacterium]|jgi:phosphomannomutase|nr:phosphoglucosamine mutase [Gemmatimonadales bacterium]